MLFILIPFLYLMVGTMISRADYARRANAVNSKDVTSKSIRLEMRQIAHSNSCYLGRDYGYKYDGSGGRDCDCSKAKEFRRLKNLLRETPAISGPYPMLFAWPFIGYHYFLTNGKPPASKLEIANYERIEQIEKELGLGVIG